MGAGHPHGVELAAMPLHLAAQGLVHQVLHLFAADAHIGQPLAGEQQLGGQGLGFLLIAGAEALAGFTVVDGADGDGYALLDVEHLVGAEHDREAI